MHHMETEQSCQLSAATLQTSVCDYNLHVSSHSWVELKNNPKCSN